MDNDTKVLDTDSARVKSLSSLPIPLNLTVLSYKS